MNGKAKKLVFLVAAVVLLSIAFYLLVIPAQEKNAEVGVTDAQAELKKAQAEAKKLAKDKAKKEYKDKVLELQKSVVIGWIRKRAMDIKTQAVRDCPGAISYLIGSVREDCLREVESAWQRGQYHGQAYTEFMKEQRGLLPFNYDLNWAPQQNFTWIYNPLQ